MDKPKEICGAVELKIEGADYKLHYHHSLFPNTDEKQFEQGSIVPRKYGGYKELMES